MLSTKTTLPGLPSDHILPIFISNEFPPHVIEAQIALSFVLMNRVSSVLGRSRVTPRTLASTELDPPFQDQKHYFAQPVETPPRLHQDHEAEIISRKLT